MVKLTKSQLTEILEKWLRAFLKQKYSDKYVISVIKPNRMLSKLTHPKIAQMKNISFFDFKPDLLGILENKETRNVEVVFLNRELKAFSLRELGEMQCYCRVAHPKLAFMASLQGLSPQIDKLINHNKKHEIIRYDAKKIKVFRWDEGKNCIDLLSVTPLEERSFFQ